jgi:hypothetical protein
MRRERNTSPHGSSGVPAGTCRSAGHRSDRRFAIRPWNRRRGGRVMARPMTRPSGPPLALLLTAFVVAGCGEEPDASRFQGASTPTKTTDSPQSAEPIRLEGTGRRRERLVFETATQLVMDVVSRGRGRFVATASASWGEALLFDTDGPVNGEITVPGVSGEPLLVDVRTKRAWQIEVTQPTPSDDDPLITSEFSGRRPRAIPVQVGPTPPRSLHVVYPRKGRFEAWAHPYEEYVVGTLLVDARGPLDRSFPITQALSGSFLVWVRADGPWRIRFAG